MAMGKQSTDLCLPSPPPLNSARRWRSAFKAKQAREKTGGVAVGPWKRRSDDTSVMAMLAEPNRSITWDQMLQYLSSEAGDSDY